MGPVRADHLILAVVAVVGENRLQRRRRLRQRIRRQSAKWQRRPSDSLRRSPLRRNSDGGDGGGQSGDGETALSDGGDGQIPQLLKMIPN